MKISFRAWSRPLALVAAIAYGNLALAQQPLTVVELAQPIVPAPTAEAEPSEDAPAPAAPAPIPAPGPGATPVAEAAPAQQQPAEAPAPLAPTEVEPADNAVVEIIRERYPSGSIRIEREMTQDAEGNYVPHGAWRHFDEKGRLIMEGRFASNQKEGTWRRLYRGDDAPLLATMPYKDFTAPFISTGNFYNGQLHGKWTITDSRQRKVHEIEFIDGQRHGKSTWYYPNGSLMLQAHYEHGRVSGDVIKFAADSSVIAKENYQNGRKLAPKVEFHDAAQSAKKSETTYLHATLVVKTPDSWETAQLATFETRGQDEKHGPYTAFHRNGQPAKQGEYRYNLPVGKIVYWYANGQKQMEGMYVDGKQQGVWSWWHENGLKSIAGEYHDGSPVGKWSWWKETGKLAQKADLSAEKPLTAATPQAPDSPREAKLQLPEPTLELR
ncbi:MAG: hypothetical protein SFU86_11830 [Pirellulaceae bacterium]|nr:hypothetical protein [Pirellulaceae bacterium]